MCSHHGIDEKMAELALNNNHSLTHSITDHSWDATLKYHKSSLPMYYKPLLRNQHILSVNQISWFYKQKKVYNKYLGFLIMQW
jgi:hypothetical protein